MDPEAPSRRPIDVPLLAGIAIGGAIIGLLSSLGAIPGTLELVAWVVLGTAALIATLRRIPRDAFRHLAFGFTLAGFVGGDVKILFWDRFLANNADLVNQTLAQGAESVPRTAVAISDTVTGILFGLVFGGIATYLVRRNPSIVAHDEEE